MSDTRLDLVHCEDIDDDRLREFRSIASWFASRLQAYRRRIIDMQSEFDRLTAERDEWKRDAGRLAESSGNAARVTRARETIDGVECERIRGLDVIIPVGLVPGGEEPAEVRSFALPFSSKWISNRGSLMGRRDGMPHYCGDLRILLADKPAPATTPTWTPPAGFGDGKYVSTDETLVFQSGDWVTHKALGWIYPGRYETAKPGYWQVESGRATYLGPNQEATQ